MTPRIAAALAALRRLHLTLPWHRLLFVTGSACGRNEGLSSLILSGNVTQRGRSSGVLLLTSNLTRNYVDTMPLCRRTLCQVIC